MNANMENNSNQSLKSQKPCGSQETSENMYQKMLDHLVLLCSQKGFKEYGWQRAKELEKNPYGFYEGISADLVKIMKEKNAQTKE
jgi:hypothetical protein